MQLVTLSKGHTRNTATKESEKIPYLWTENPKIQTLSAARTYMAHMWEYPSRAQALALFGDEAELHNYSLEYWLLIILK